MKLVAASTILASAMATHELRKSTPTHYSKIGVPEKSSLIELTFLLRNNEAGVEDLKREFQARSDPNNTLYGKWLSNDEVHLMTQPSKEAVQAMSQFGARCRDTSCSFMTLETTFAAAEELLDTTYHKWQHKDGAVLHRTDRYTLPKELADHVVVVGPTVRFPNSPSAILGGELEAGQGNDPATLRKLYKVNDAVGGAASSNRQAVTAFLKQLYSEDDLNTFFDNQAPFAAKTPISLIGDATAGSPGVESMLDIEYMPAMGALNPTEFWGFSGASPNDAEDEPFLTWLYTAGNTTDAEIPLVFSTSYGEDEDSEVTTDYSDRINVEFMKLGVRGVSVLFASGDSGAVGMGPDKCPGDKFVPKWPSGSPYITAVGGTLGKAMPEESWTGSSGGFSNVFETPAWQKDAVAAYVNITDSDMPALSYYSQTGRGFPDISAAAVEYPVVIHGATMGVAGTSCASPCASGIFGMLNDARLAAGKSSLGFLNPVLYANAGALNDVTIGKQQGCSAKVGGFPAKEGWDAVTGLGSPNYEKLLEVVMALP